MKTTNSLILAALTLPMALITSCGKDGTSSETPKTPVATSRYQTVPYVGTKAGDKLDNLVFSDYDGQYNYYFFALGHVKSAPLAYRPAIYYNGVTPITVGYSSSNVTEQSISNSVTEAFENSVTESQSTNWGDEIGVVAGIETTFKVPLTSEMKVKIETSYKNAWGGSESTDVTQARSFSNTYETSSSKASEIRDEISVTIGTSGEPEGLYRFALFTTTDVYFVVITDRAKTEVIEAKIAFCARPTQYWELDYDPERGGSFGKTASGALLQIPDLTISELPDILACEHNWGQWILTTPPTGTANGEETRTCSICNRTETRVVQGGTGLFDLSTGTWVIGTGNASFSNNILTVNNTANFAVTGTVNKGQRISIVGSAKLTLQNLSITGLGSGLSPLTISYPATNVTLVLDGINTLTAGAGCAGIQTYTSSTLTIEGGGELTVTGGDGGAGIGGGRGSDGANGEDRTLEDLGVGENGGAGGGACTIIINSGTVRATSGTGAAAIGGGRGGNGGNGLEGPYIVKGGDGGRGGNGGNGGNVTINGGSVTAMGNGYDIGGGNGGKGGKGGDANLQLIMTKGTSGSGGNGGNGGRGVAVTLNGGTLTTSRGDTYLAYGGAGGAGGAAGALTGSYAGLGTRGSDGASGSSGNKGIVTRN